MKEVKLYINNAGFCIAKERHAIKGGSNKSIKFGALFGLIQHPTMGWILFDTGYTDRFFEATKYFPNKIYALATKVEIKKEDEVKSQLSHFGLTCSDIKHLIVSHFHADHIGGLQDFENAIFYCSKKAFYQAKNCNKFLGFSKGILKSLIPADMESRIKFIDEISHPVQDDIFGIKYDLFNDQSIFVYDLPGHAAGQIGIELKTKKKKYFLIADACWLEQSYKELILPSSIVKLFFDSCYDFKVSLNKVHQFHLRNPEVIIIPTHCAKTTEAIIPKIFDIDVL